MPRSKTTESRNSYKGVRKLSKKTSKKASKKGSSKKVKNINTTTEDMLDILNSDDNIYTGKVNTNNNMNPQLQQYQQNIDPYLVYETVQTDPQGNMTGTNKIGSLLGIAQLNNTSQYVPPTNLIDSAVPSYNPQNMPLGVQELNSNLTLSPMMPQQIMPQQMMPQQMMPQQMMGQQQMMPQQINNSMLKNFASLSNIPRFA